ncbi:hypothetical protein WSS_A37215 [Rhodococcus opacus M213]|uniref:Uncharacterized protein n=1 Tax=Rhodococcus opacus M213 TaxID=1129896 RepID=K8X7L2_RHOOP|nr:hypothetical protein WSS_A37215 [Rhodococcus opacus M213]
MVVDEFARADSGLAGDSGEFRADRLLRLVGGRLLLRAPRTPGAVARSGDSRIIRFKARSGDSRGARFAKG